MTSDNLAEQGLKIAMAKVRLDRAEYEEHLGRLRATKSALDILQSWFIAPLEKVVPQHTGMTGFELWDGMPYSLEGASEDYRANIQPVISLMRAMRGEYARRVTFFLLGIYLDLTESHVSSPTQTLRDPETTFNALKDGVAMSIAALELVQEALVPLPTGAPTPDKLRKQLERMSRDESIHERERFFSDWAVRMIIDRVFNMQVAGVKSVLIATR